MDEVIAKAIYSWVCPKGDCEHENTLEEGFERTDAIEPDEVITECELCGEKVKVLKE